MMEMAQVLSRQSTCSRLGVGAIIARDHRVMSTGYNGVASGEPHCNHSQTDGKCTDAVHAEANAIVFAARHGVATGGANLYVTHSPCVECARLIVNAGISEVFYLIPYRIKDGIHLMQRAGLTVTRLNVLEM